MAIAINLYSHILFYMKYQLGLLEHDPDVFRIRDYGSRDQDQTKIYHDSESILEWTTPF